jgi:hypothetical protein
MYIVNQTSCSKANTALEDTDKDSSTGQYLNSFSRLYDANSANNTP